MAFTAHSGRRTYPPDLYRRPEVPHHVHRLVDDEGALIQCADHRECPPGHWIGGKPQSNHPHHVEFDGATGHWGYTRLTKEEIDDLAHLQAFELDRERAFAAQLQAKEDRKRAAREILRLKAKDDPLWAAMADLFGIDPSS